ncbi:hypothetical protein KEM55_006507 [Ascosphaera atra]|nr:hypothetical protein KEM55_006507 [Ascosphaera atra]
MPFPTHYRLMDHYDLRSCFLPTLSGLQLRTYQFQTLMARHLPKLHAHLEKLGVEPVYVSQWFLSFFGVTCPLPMLLRIYDVLLVEGACETLMRVALSLMQRNETKLLALTEYSDVMQLLLSRSLWDTYAYSADDLVEDFVSLTAMVTRESLDSLEEQYERQKSGGGSVQFPALQAAAARFLGRLWSGNNGGSAAPSIKSQANGASGTSTPTTKESLEMKRTPSKQSMASTLNSMDTASSDTSTAPTESWNSGSDASGTKKHKRQNTVTSSRNTDRDRDLNAQIEDLLMALTELQRAQAELARDLQREREEREEDQKIALRMLAYIKERPDGDGCQEMIEQATERFVATRSTSSKRTSIVQSKGQLQEEVAHWKEKHTIEATRCHELTRTLDDKEAGMSMLRDELRETRSRLQESYAEKQRLERTVKGLRQQQQERELRDSQGSKRSSTSTAGSGLRELRLGRTDSIISQGSLHSSASPTTTFNKRSSSLGIPLSSSAMQASSSAATSSPSAWVSPMPAIPAEDSPATAKPAVTVAVPRDANAAAASTGSYMSSPTAISPQPQPCQGSQPASQPSSSETTTQTVQQSNENKQNSAANQEQDPETLLLELVQSKTQEAIARQELEEVKAKLDSLRRLIKREGGAESVRRGRTPSPGNSVSSVPSLNSPRTRLSAASGTSFLSADPKSLSAPSNLSRSVTTTAVSPPATGAARFFSGWGRKAADAK